MSHTSKGEGDNSVNRGGSWNNNTEFRLLNSAEWRFAANQYLGNRHFAVQVWYSTLLMPSNRARRPGLVGMSKVLPPEK